ncbi:RNA polymerase sigma factor [Leeuwenhoekiella polynyae]|uniref:RNA polymerase sigma-70 factor (ECF subfamily) n=1 Tax=Leeuwenhoekiella polynyae TaxID=1550906 RepID=A0A4Q0PIL3_9FLAO|nr:RNA polymerase sigma-70 factor [Leeuwenhoekiella polynyae]RXG26131.1 RNA polymerase sigma-70 factor (ECF subfamily) [Leeuwenhoekiella polynyae]
MSEQINNTWVIALKKGDKNAHAFLIEKYSPSLMGYVFSLTNDKASAKDILQNVFMKIWEKRERLAINTSLKSYLFKSAYNEFINHYKKESAIIKLEKKYHESLERVAKESDDESLEKIMSEIFNEIERLSPKCKEVFLLSRKDGLTNKEIAQYLNISVKTVEAQISKAFKTLRKKLEVKLYMMLFLLRDCKM